MDDINDGAFDYMLDMCEPSPSAIYKASFEGYAVYRDTLSAFNECFGITESSVDFDGVDYHPLSMSEEFLAELRKHKVACNTTFHAAWAANDIVGSMELDLCKMQRTVQSEEAVTAYERAIDTAVKHRQYFDGEYSRAIIAFTQWMQDKMR